MSTVEHWHPFRQHRVPAVMALVTAAFLFGDPRMAVPTAHGDEGAAAPRAAAWKTIEKALAEGKPQTAAKALRGIEQAAVAEKAWAEAARAIATRILTETGDRPPDDPERLVRLHEAIGKAPPETRSVLTAIAANWTWGYFQMNRWRYQQRTQGAANGGGIAAIATWDLPTIVREIRLLFAAAVGAAGSPERDALQRLPVDQWSALISPGTVSDAYRPTVWDVIVRDAIDFSSSGERGLVAPEDAFEFDASAPALANTEAFLAWKPEDDAAVTDRDSPLLDTVRLYRELLAFHKEDANPSARLAADIDRILWAGGVAVSTGEAGDLEERKEAALRGCIERAGTHETAAVARFHLASLVLQGDGRGDPGDPLEARGIALAGAETHPDTPGGRLCRGLVVQIEAPELSLVTETTWADPWPVVRVTYRNLGRVHLRLAKADFAARLKAGKPHASWLDAADRTAIMALPAVREHVADLPATPDYRSRHHDIPVASLAPQELEPGTYWVVASHRPDFGDADNAVFVTMVRVTRLAIVAEQNGPVAADVRDAVARGGRRPDTIALSGHVVDVASGLPVANAAVQAFVRVQQGGPPPFAAAAATSTDKDGRYELAVEPNREHVVVATADVGGRRHEAATDPAHVWRQEQPETLSTIVLVTDRGIHRPGQLLHYKGIAASGVISTGDYRAVAGREVVVILRDANGREAAQARHTTNANGSFHGSFPIATGALPGQWQLQAGWDANVASSGVGVRVEEYKRPKFLVKLAAPDQAATLGGGVTLSGTASTYTGVAVAGAKVRWHVERAVRWPLWCRWFYPWLPFDSGGQRIGRGTAVTDEGGRFTIRFDARPDRTVPRESLPVFTYSVVADVTDSSGETRTDTRRVSVGYTDVEASISTDEWHAAEKNVPAAVSLVVATNTLDGLPRAATGTLTVSRLVQPAEVVRRELLGNAHPGPQPLRPRGRNRGASRPAPRPQAADPADPRTWATGAGVLTEKLATDAATGKATTTARLPTGIYRAVFEIPAADDRPAVKAESLVEVVDPAATHYGVKRPLLIAARRTTVEPESDFSAVVGTGYGQGRALVDVSQRGKTLARYWTEPGRTQWPVGMPVTAAHRGGFTVRVWLVRDGRLHVETRTIDVPWNNKRLEIAWERFTRRLEPGAKEVWRAKITTVADPEAGPAAPAAAEFLALAYDQSLDSLAAHAWPGAGLLGLFRRESTWTQLVLTNRAEGFGHLLGQFDVRRVEQLPIRYREFREPFGSPARGGGWFQGMRMRRMGGGGVAFAAAEALAVDAAPASAPLGTAAGAMLRKSAPTADARDAGNANSAQEKKAQEQQDKQGAPPGPPPVATAAPPPPRKNLVETAFFLPTLASEQDGGVTIEFTLPDTLTTWQFKGFAHDAALRSGTIVAEAISAKDLMVEPVLPRFLREGDVVQIPVKVSNTSTGRLSGTVQFSLADARTDANRDALIDGPRQLPFDLAAGESRPVMFTVKVADGTEVLRYRATGTAGKAADGEEAMVPVLPRRVLVTETVPVTIRGPRERTVSLDRLLKSGGGDLRSQSLVVQAAANPAWYAVLALPAIMEEADESTETLFTRLYANTLAGHLATSDPRIGKVFEQWRGTAAVESPLEKNTDLMKTLLAETPWVREAVDEKEARARIGLLFDATRAANETRSALERLQALRNGDGGWPWFPGGQTCDSVTLGIIAGFGRLRAAGTRADMQPAIAALPWLDGRLVEEKARAERLWKDKPAEVVLTPIGVYALYARSFFAADAAPVGPADEAVRWALEVGRRCWTKLDTRLSQGQLAIALFRSGDRATSRSIIDSLKQRAVDADVRPGEEKESWQGMWWRDPHPGWWSWAHAPIATQTIMIEAFDEVAGDTDAVEALKVWLLSQKRTSRWRGGRATADAVSALLGRGVDLLGPREPVAVTVGAEAVRPEVVEAGTGFFETRFVRREIEPAFGTVTFKKADAGLAWGGVHWQYLDDISAVPAAGREELAVDKKLFVKRMTKAGAELVPIGAGPVEPGDELVVRLVVTSDRDYEFLELTDHRPSLTEPMDVLSGWRWGDGAGWYVAVRDASTQMFFERLPRGTHVLEYSLRAAHRGAASSGFASIRSRYAPEFSAHSASVAVEVR